MLSLMEAGGVAFLLAVLLTPVFRRFLQRRSIGQHIREDGPVTHRRKEGTPTMGGVAIVGAALVGYLMGHVGTKVTITRSGALIFGVTIASALLGLADDYLGVRNARNLGLNKRWKFAGQLAIAIIFAVLAVNWVHAATNLSVIRTNGPGLHLGPVGWAIFAIFIVVAFANAVNFTDGVDGLVAGSATFSFAVLAIIGYWLFRNPKLYHFPAALDIGLVAVSLVGACLGFLWWNAAPARIIMGDTGALAIGTAFGAVALLLHLDLLLVVIGGLYVVEAASVVLQIISFRLFHRRIFRMAPLHHHFELSNWPETTVLIRLWILAGLLAALGLGIFYVDFLRINPVA